MFQTGMASIESTKKVENKEVEMLIPHLQILLKKPLEHQRHEKTKGMVNFTLSTIDLSPSDSIDSLNDPLHLPKEDKKAE